MSKVSIALKWMEGKKVGKIPNHLFHFLFSMCKSLIPIKKREVEIDFGECLLCHSDKKSEYCKSSLERIVDEAFERKKYKDNHLGNLVIEVRNVVI